MGHGEILDLMIYDGLQDPYTGRHMGEIGEDERWPQRPHPRGAGRIALRSYRLAQEAVTERDFRGRDRPGGQEEARRGRRLSTPTRSRSGLTSTEAHRSSSRYSARTAPSPPATPPPSTTARPCCSSPDAEGLKQRRLTPKARIVAYAT